MPNKDLDRRMPFGVDETAIRQLNTILLRAAGEIERDLRNTYSEEIRKIEETNFIENPHFLRGKKEALEEAMLSSVRTNAKFQYVLACSDRTSDHRLDLNDFLHFPNYDNAKVNKLGVSLRSYSDNYINVETRTDPYILENIRCTVRGDNRFINDFGTELEKWLLSVRKKYWIAYRAGIALAFFLALFVIATPLLYLGSDRLDIDGKNNTWEASAIIGVTAIVLSVWATPILTFFGRRLFPIGEFSIGRGTDRQRRREYFIYSLFGVAIVLGLAVRVFGNLVSAWFTTLATGR